MGNDPMRREPQDRSRINASQPWEIEYWCEALDASPEELKQAVKTVGPQVEKVREFLARSAA
jgi:hypothetical protein